MSKRNKRCNKLDRKYERSVRKGVNNRDPLARQKLNGAVSDVDATALLCDPKQKLTAPARRYLKRCRASVLVMPVPVVRPLAVKLAEKLASLKLTQVLRRRSQFAARAAGAKYKLSDLSPNSRFRPALQRVQDGNLHALKQANAELKARKLHATGQLVTN